MQQVKDEDYPTSSASPLSDGVMEWEHFATSNAESWALEVLHGKDNPRALSVPWGFFWLTGDHRFFYLV